MKKYKFIFDLDGTLYRFDQGQSKNFADSLFYKEIKKNVSRFFVEKLGLGRAKAMEEYERIKNLYKGEVSLGVEKEYGINRYKYFADTWNLDPSKYLVQNPKLKELFRTINGSIALLSNAPSVWAEKALRFLEIDQYFQGAIFTGEPDGRKPQPEAFQRVINYFQVTPENIISVGDQEETDIIPAQKLGMKTIIVGKEDSMADFKIESIDRLLNLLSEEGFV